MLRNAKQSFSTIHGTVDNSDITNKSTEMGAVWHYRLWKGPRFTAQELKEAERRCVSLSWGRVPSTPRASAYNPGSPTVLILELQTHVSEKAYLQFWDP